MKMDSNQSHGSLAWACCAVALVVVGCTLRLLVARGDLWLDEIWSMNLARQADTWLDIFISTHSDNNHYLMTLWMQQLDPSAASILIRLPSLLAGLVTMVVILLRPLGINRREALACLFLVAVSPILIEYDSEARGYGMALACGMTMIWMLDRYLLGRRYWWLVGVGALASLGLLCHLTFAFLIAGSVAWAGLSWWHRRLLTAHAWWLVVTFLAPALVVGVLWWIDLRHLQVGGGNPYILSDVLGALFGFAIGLPQGPLVWLGFLVVLVALWEIIQLARSGRSEWILFATTIFIVPALLLGIARPSILAPRYFLVGVPLLLLLLGRVLARVSERRKWVALGLGLVIILGTGIQNRDLVVNMRGSYREAIDFISRNSPASDQTIGSDHDFRNWTVLAYYLPQNPMAGRLRYLPRGSAGAHPPYWYIRHEFDADGPHELRVKVFGDQSYELVRIYPYSGLSGCRWLLYRKFPTNPIHPASNG